MKKMMFNDTYGLTMAVITGNKTQTRRICKFSKEDALGRSPYRVGEVVAVAQRYEDISLSNKWEEGKNKSKTVFDENCSGWRNKMFVKSELMRHHIRITNVEIEYLNDISDEDCLCEGITRYLILGEDKVRYDTSIYSEKYLFGCEHEEGLTPRIAYSKLIDKIGKKGDWDKNPLVYKYTFELVD